MFSPLANNYDCRFWINWPRDRYAFIPVKMRIELSEISGKIHFGVQKRASFISFLEEPYSRFSVKSEVGGEYKLKDLPRISTFIVSKLKKYIRTKVVFPKAYKFRLMWPKKWWPDGPDEYKESVPSSSSAKSAPEVASSGEVAKDSKSMQQSDRDVVAVASDSSKAVANDTGKAAGYSGTATDMLATTGAVVKNSISKWFSKPFPGQSFAKKEKSRGKEAAKQVPVPGPQGSDAYLDNSDDDESSDEDIRNMCPPQSGAGEDDKSQMKVAIRSFLIGSQPAWDKHFQDIFALKGDDSDNSGSITMPVIDISSDPHVLSAIQESRVKAGLNRNARSQTSLRKLEASHGLADSFEMRSQEQVLRQSSASPETLTNAENRDKFQRSNSIADFRSESILLMAYEQALKAMENSGGIDADDGGDLFDTDAAATGADVAASLGNNDSNKSRQNRWKMSGTGVRIDKWLAGRIGSGKMGRSLKSSLRRLSNAGEGMLTRAQSSTIDRGRNRSATTDSLTYTPGAHGNSLVSAATSLFRPSQKRGEEKRDNSAMESTRNGQDSVPDNVDIDTETHPKFGSDYASTDSVSGSNRIASFFGFNRQLGKAKEALKSGLSRRHSKKPIEAIDEDTSAFKKIADESKPPDISVISPSSGNKGSSASPRGSSRRSENKSMSGVSIDVNAMSSSSALSPKDDEVVGSDAFMSLLQRNLDATAKAGGQRMGESTAQSSADSVRTTLPVMPSFSPKSDNRDFGSPTSSKPSVSPVVSGPVDPEKEAIALAWEARAKAIAVAAADGELPSIQGFLNMQKNASEFKKWLVLRNGFLGVFNDPSENTQFGSPLTVVNLQGSICRPYGNQPCSFEVGIPVLEPVKSSSPGSSQVIFHWMQFWAESEVQCKAWIIGIQHSALRHSDK
jgi:hypothetical protein